MENENILEKLKMQKEIEKKVLEKENDILNYYDIYSMMYDNTQVQSLILDYILDYETKEKIIEECEKKTGAFENEIDKIRANYCISLFCSFLSRILNCRWRALDMLKEKKANENK